MGKLLRDYYNALSRETTVAEAEYLYQKGMYTECADGKISKFGQNDEKG